MAGYDVFARYYDALTANVDYAGRAAYLAALLKNLGHEPGLTLDLACGTGSLTLELHKLGFDVYGVDGSVSMLSEAKDKAYDMDADVLFLYQKMQSLDLYGTVDTVFCSLDSINHLPGAEQVLETFKRVAFFMNDDSWFVFDVNTPYKHEHVLGSNTFVYDLADIYCVWQNTYDPQDGSVAISLDFFEKQGKTYTRSSERFSEQVYSPEEITEMLRKAGFDDVRIYGDMSFEAPKETEQRLVIAAHITNSQNGIFEG
ncbi:MAG: class I SAM-dependent methyltransferase [Clostridia bacterium]|nr:class I SAM-dependent methyltransferase [Clostridia bacterium]